MTLNEENMVCASLSFWALLLLHNCWYILLNIAGRAEEELLSYVCRLLPLLCLNLGSFVRSMEDFQQKLPDLCLYQ